MATGAATVALWCHVADFTGRRAARRSPRFVAQSHQWKDQPATTYTASRQVTAGDHELKVEYYENGGAAVAKLAIWP
jgi:hypothetical protein